jgi:hypothetical protein
MSEKHKGLDCDCTRYIRTVAGYDILAYRDSYGSKMYMVVDPRGYIGRTRVATVWTYRESLAEIRAARKK